MLNTLQALPGEVIDRFSIMATAVSKAHTPKQGGAAKPCIGSACSHEVKWASHSLDSNMLSLAPRCSVLSRNHGAMLFMTINMHFFLRAGPNWSQRHIV